MIILNFLRQAITSAIGMIIAKIFMWICIILLAHGALIMVGETVNGRDISYGSALGQAVRGDVNFILNNSEEIIETAKETKEDFTAEFQK